MSHKIILAVRLVSSGSIWTTKRKLMMSMVVLVG